MDSFEGTRFAVMSTFACGGRDLVMDLGSAFIVSYLSVGYCILSLSTQLDVTVSIGVVRKDRQFRDLPLDCCISRGKNRRIYYRVTIMELLSTNSRAFPHVYTYSGILPVGIDLLHGYDVVKTRFL